MREPGNPKVSKKFEPNDEREQIVNLFIDYRISPYPTSTPLYRNHYMTVLILSPRKLSKTI